MRYYLLLMFWLVTVTRVSAQKIYFSDTSNKWKTLQAYADIGPVHFVHDYSYYGIVSLNGYQYSFLNGSIGIREDTVLGRVYAKGISAVSMCDTIERVLYDYTLSTGDTFWTYSCNDTIGYRVTSVDSVIINGAWYKKQSFNCVSHCGFTPPYTVIEGLGCSINPGFTFRPRAEFPDRVICFANNGSYPTISGFQNDCTLSVDDAHLAKWLRVIPNPVTDNARIVFPYKMPTGSLSIYDASGRVVDSKVLNEVEMVNLSCGSLATGIYLFELRDLGNGRRFIGKLSK